MQNEKKQAEHALSAELEVIQNLSNALSEASKPIADWLKQKYGATDLDIELNTRFEHSRFQISCRTDVEDCIIEYGSDVFMAMVGLEGRLTKQIDIAAAKRAKAAQLIAEAEALEGKAGAK